MRWILAMMTVVLVLAACSGDEGSAPRGDDPVDSTGTTTTTSASTATSAPTTTISAEEVFAERVDTIEVMVAAHNSGDFEAWVSGLSETPSIFGNTDRDEWWEWQRSMVSANEVWAITGDCQRLGQVRVT